MSKKVNMIGSKSVFVKYIFKILLLSFLSVGVLSALLSAIILKLDLRLDFAAYISILIIAVSSVFVSYYSVSSFSNNGAVLGIISILPLFVYSLINTIIYTNNWLVFSVKFSFMIILSAFFGNLSIKKRKKIRVK